MKAYGKICHQEGVVIEKEFSSKELAQIFCDGFDAAREITSEDDLDSLDEYFAVVDTEPSKEE